MNKSEEACKCRFSSLDENVCIRTPRANLDVSFFGGLPKSKRRSRINGKETIERERGKTEKIILGNPHWNWRNLTEGSQPAISTLKWMRVNGKHVSARERQRERER